VAVATLVAHAASLPVATLGSRYGELPGMLPPPHLPPISLGRVVEMFPTAVSFALLAGIESLLSAVVADSMTGRRHRANAELVAQGAANVASALFGGICVTGLIARTATNIRAGGRSPVAGLLHAAFVLVFMAASAWVATAVPLAALGAVLAVVAWNMAEKHEFAALLRASWGDAAVLIVTFLLVIFRDLTTGILVGFGIGALLFLHRMAQMVEAESGAPVIEADRADWPANVPRAHYDVALATDRDVVVYRISGAFFFGAAAAVASALDRIGSHPRAFVIDFGAVPFIDATAAVTVAAFARKAQRHHATVFVAGARPAVRRTLLTHGARPPLVRFRASLDSALEAARTTTETHRSVAAAA
jgi:SulP family sulfate permease